MVQYFDSYKFKSKTYYDIGYHFKSIDTWLEGTCKSHCPEHDWKTNEYLKNVELKRAEEKKRIGSSKLLSLSAENQMANSSTRFGSVFTNTAASLKKEKLLKKLNVDQNCYINAGSLDDCLNSCLVE